MLQIMGLGDAEDIRLVIGDWLPCFRCIVYVE
jgi:hypothetical protein